MKIEFRWNGTDPKASDLLAGVKALTKINVMAGSHDGRLTGSVEYLMFEAETLDQEISRIARPGRPATIIISKILEFLATKGVTAEVWIDNMPLLIFAAMEQRIAIHRMHVIRTAISMLKETRRWFAEPRIKEIRQTLERAQ